MNDIEKIQKEIADLRHKLETVQLAMEDRQMILCDIDDKKHKIEELSRKEPIIIHNNDAKIKDRKPDRKSSSHFRLF